LIFGAIGHCHPIVSEAAAKQCMELVHGQCSIAFHGPYLRLIEKLLPIMPHKSMDSFFFWNSGSEAVEAAIKMARAITGKQNIIGMQGQSDLGHKGIFSLLIISTQAATMAELTELWRSLKVK